VEVDEKVEGDRNRRRKKREEVVVVVVEEGRRRLGICRGNRRECW
jgi:hypothetical protein